MRWTKTKFALLLGIVSVVGIFTLLPAESHWKRASTWQVLASPGDLFHGHAGLERDCSACHTPVRGAEPAKCVHCHAADEALLQRQPTAFHGSVKSCVECHAEHRGEAQRPTHMDHGALARIGLKELERGQDQERVALEDFLSNWVNAGETAARGMRATRLEAVLDCSTCHANEDQHFGLFGSDCAQCHGTSAWSLPEFRHPSPKSRDCAQCHQAPPSHYMGHFKMISQKIAAKPKAEVAQCFECHRTTAWTDIPGIGHYKHH